MNVNRHGALHLEDNLQNNQLIYYDFVVVVVVVNSRIPFYFWLILECVILENFKKYCKIKNFLFFKKIPLHFTFIFTKLLVFYVTTFVMKSLKLILYFFLIFPICWCISLFCDKSETEPGCLSDWQRCFYLPLF